MREKMILKKVMLQELARGISNMELKLLINFILFFINIYVFIRDFKVKSLIGIFLSIIGIILNIILLGVILWQK